MGCCRGSYKASALVSLQSGETHLVRHLKFTHWPDHGVPHCSDQLVRFIRYMRAVHGSGPVTVHCSAGIGRAGVLICIDVILGLIGSDLPVSKRGRVWFCGVGLKLAQHNVKECSTKRNYAHKYNSSGFSSWKHQPTKRYLIKTSSLSAD